jgi:hypothetical protein
MMMIPSDPMIPDDDIESVSSLQPEVLLTWGVCCPLYRVVDLLLVPLFERGKSELIAAF